jgi:uracil-DNA glycosylase family protein
MTVLVVRGKAAGPAGGFGQAIAGENGGRNEDIKNSLYLSGSLNWRRRPGVAGREVLPMAQRNLFDSADGPRVTSLTALRAAVDECRRCSLYMNATQGVSGEGPKHAAMVLVGEQPGDKEDLAGKPFVGPAGRLLDRALQEVGVERDRAFVTNAVKHFKHEMRGKRRLHKRPNAYEIDRCRWWLERELAIVKPAVIVALGATAARSLFQRPMAIGKNRGQQLAIESGTPTFITIHPSALLRIEDAADKQREFSAFVADLRGAAAALRRRAA